MRRVHLLLIVVAAVAFLAVSAVLARVWSSDGAERSAVTELVRAEARGDQAGMLSRLRGCRDSASCRSRVAQDIAALTRPGTVSILQLATSTGFSFAGTLGTARVAWNVASSRPIVQCVRVRRAGDALQGLQVQLLEISPRITSDADCPAKF